MYACKLKYTCSSFTESERVRVSPSWVEILLIIRMYFMHNNDTPTPLVPSLLINNPHPQCPSSNVIRPSSSLQHHHHTIQLSILPLHPSSLQDPYTATSLLHSSYFASNFSISHSIVICRSQPYPCTHGAQNPFCTSLIVYRSYLSFRHAQTPFFTVSQHQSCTAYIVPRS